MNRRESGKIQEMIFWGGTGLAKVLREAITGLGFKLVAVFDKNNELKSPFRDVPIYYGRLAFEKWLKQRKRKPLGFLVAIGGDKGKDRISIQNYLESLGLVAMTVKHPTAFVADNAMIGSGSQILAQSAVCVEAVVGCGCIINTGAMVDHECRIGEGVHIGPGAHLAGCIEVGPYATIYTGAVISPRIKIGEGAIIGAGAVVRKDVSPYQLVAGNPARVVGPEGRGTQRQSSWNRFL